MAKKIANSEKLESAESYMKHLLWQTAPLAQRLEVVEKAQGIYQGIYAQATENNAKWVALGLEAPVVPARLKEVQEEIDTCKRLAEYYRESLSNPSLFPQS